MYLKCLIFLALLPFTLTAQRSAELGLTAGTMWYNGELNPARQLHPFNFAGGLIFRHNWNYRYSLRLTASHGSLEGNDHTSTSFFQHQRNLSFRTPLSELAGAVEFNFSPYEISSYPFTFFIFGGFSMFRMNPSGERGELQHALNEPDKSYSRIQPAIPFGAGFKFNFGGRLGFTLEWGVRKTFTDYIDDVSTTWAPLISGNETINNPFTGFQRGNSKNKDWYSHLNVGLVYLLKKKYTCPAYNRGI